MRKMLNDIVGFARSRPSLPPTDRCFSRAGIVRAPANTHNLRTRLKALAITQSQFADLCEVHPNTLGNWAAGRTRMNAAADRLLEDCPEVRRALCMDTKTAALREADRSRKAIPIASEIANGPRGSQARRWRGRSPRTIASSNCCNCPEAAVLQCREFSRRRRRSKPTDWILNRR